jgi:hypothetical protein
MEDIFVGCLQPIAVVPAHLSGTRRYVRLFGKLRSSISNICCPLQEYNLVHLKLLIARPLLGAYSLAYWAGSCIPTYSTQTR